MTKHSQNMQNLIFILLLLILACHTPKKEIDPPYVQVKASSLDTRKESESLQVIINDITIIRSDSCRGDVSYVPEIQELDILSLIHI